jgi:Periplasmic binding protein
MAETEGLRARGWRALRLAADRSSRKRSTRWRASRVPRGVPIVAFSTDASIAARGVYLLSFLPESDVRRIVEFAASRGKRSFAALLPDKGYGTVAKAAFQQEVAQRGGHVVALEKYPIDPARMGEAVRRFAHAASRADTIFIRTTPTSCRKSRGNWRARASISNACSSSTPDCGTILASLPKPD